MKTRKILSLITVLALMLSVVALPVYAVDTSTRISDELKAVMDKAGSSDKIDVTIWTVDIDKDLALKRIEEMSGTSKAELDQMYRNNTVSKEELDKLVDKYTECSIKVKKAMHAEITDRVFAAAGITDEDITVRSMFSPMHMLKINVDKINKLDACEDVCSIDLTEESGDPINAGENRNDDFYNVFDKGGFFNGASAGNDVKFEDGNLVGGIDGEFTVNIDNTGKNDVFKSYDAICIVGELIPKAGVTPTTSTKTYIQFGKNGTKKLISDVAISTAGSEDLADYDFPEVGTLGRYLVLFRDTFDFDGNSFTLINDNYGFKISKIYFSGPLPILGVVRTQEPKPDVKSTAIGQTASVLNDGDTTNLYTTIRNSGKDGFYEGSLEISFTVDGKVIDTVTYDKRIEVGESVTVKSSKKWSASFGAHTVKAVIKPSEKAFAKASSLKQRTNVTDN